MSLLLRGVARSKDVSVHRIGRIIDADGRQCRAESVRVAEVLSTPPANNCAVSTGSNAYVRPQNSQVTLTEPCSAMIESTSSCPSESSIFAMRSREHEH